MLDIIQFFIKVTGLIPTPEQEELLRTLTDPTQYHKIIVSCGRQTGKTLCCAVATLWYLYEYDEPLKIMLISAQDSMLYFHIRELFKRNPDLEDELSDKTKLSPNIIPIRGFEVKSGAIVSVKGSTDRQVRGFPADVVIIDEAAEIKDEIILAALGNITGQISKYILLSTPHVSNSLFVKWASDPEEHGFKLFMWNAENCNWQNPEIMKTKKKEMTPAMYAVEVLGRPPTKAERSIFPLKHLKKCYFDDLQPEGGVREAGLDFGDVVGKNVLTITEKLGIRRKELFQKAYKKIIEDALPEIREALEKFRVEIVKADPKPPENQKYIGDKIGNVPVVYIDPQYHKKEMLGQLQRHVMRHTIELNNKNVDLKRELENYRLHKRSGDDRVDSLMFSVYEFSYPKKPEVRVYL